MPGLLGPRDPAQPLLTLLDGPARVELSGSTTANWVAKTANLLVDGHDAPDRVGILLPLHWQSVCFLLGAAATGATVVVGRVPAELSGCPVCFTTPGRASSVLDAGADDVLVVSGSPMGTPVPDLAPGLLDAAREVPGYGDHFPGRPAGAFEAGGLAVEPAPDLGLTPADRVLTILGLADGLPLLLATLAAGAGLVLVPDAGSLPLPDAAAAERVTATVGVNVPGLRRIG